MFKYDGILVDSMSTSAHRTSSLSAQDFIREPTSPRKHAKTGEVNSARILQVVKASPNGITANAVAKVVGLTRPTVLLALRELERKREVYPSPSGLGTIRLWFPNGRMVHPILELYRELRGKTYRFTIQDGRAGPVIQIQERSYSLLQGERVEGAIFFEQATLDDFQLALTELKQRYDALASVGAGKQ
jgi:hypothetical protein